MDWREWVLWFIEELAQHWFLHALWLAVVGVGAMLGVLMFGRRYKERIAALEAKVAEQSKPPVKIPIKAELRHRFHKGWYTKDGTEVWIPEVWIQYEDGSSKPLDISGIEKHPLGVDIFPLGPITFRKPEKRDEQG